jgi:hypothetical protein
MLEIVSRAAAPFAFGSGATLAPPHGEVVAAEAAEERARARERERAAAEAGEGSGGGGGGGGTGAEARASGVAPSRRAVGGGAGGGGARAASPPPPLARPTALLPGAGSSPGAGAGAGASSSSAAGTSATWPAQSGALARRGTAQDVFPEAPPQDSRALAIRGGEGPYGDRSVPASAAGAPGLGDLGGAAPPIAPARSHGAHSASHAEGAQPHAIVPMHAGDIAAGAMAEAGLPMPSAGGAASAAAGGRRRSVVAPSGSPTNAAPASGRRASVAGGAAAHNVSLLARSGVADAPPHAPAESALSATPVVGGFGAARRASVTGGGGSGSRSLSPTRRGGALAPPDPADLPAADSLAATLAPLHGRLVRGEEAVSRELLRGAADA